MALENWIAISAIATFILAVAAFWAIWQNHLVQKRQRRERLLNEIVDWATQSMACEYFPDITSVFKASNFKQAAMVVYGDVDKTQAMFRKLRYRGYYMVRLVAVFKNEELQKASERFVHDLERHIQLIDKFKQVLEKSESVGEFKKLHGDAPQIDTNKLLLDRCAERVIEEAAKITTKDIS